MVLGGINNVVNSNSNLTSINGPPPNPYSTAPLSVSCGGGGGISNSGDDTSTSTCSTYELKVLVEFCTLLPWPRGLFDACTLRTKLCKASCLCLILPTLSTISKTTDMKKQNYHLSSSSNTL